MSTDGLDNLTPNHDIESRRALLMGVGGLAAGALLASSRQASAGPLVPPAGPVTSTGVTLSDINARIARPNGIAEPRIPLPAISGAITQSGSYYLTANRLVNLVINASDVTIDLCGYSVPAVDFAAIRIFGQRVKVHNGRIVPTGSGADGVRVEVSSANPANVEIADLDIDAEAAAVNASSSFAVTVRNVRWQAASNGSGILIGNSGHISGCMGFGGFVGIRAGPNSMVQSCRCSATTGIELGNASVGTHCVTEGGTTGFMLSAGASLECCSANGASATGIAATGNARISRCQVSGGTRGIDLLNGGNRVENCKISNAQDGIVSSGIDTIVDCSLNALFGGLGDGIRVLSTGQHCHIDSNYIYAFGTGVRLVAQPSFSSVTRNRIAFCTFQIIGTGALVAPIVTSAASVTNPLSNLGF